VHPVLYQNGDFVIGAYGPVYLLAFLASIGTYALLARRFTDLSFVQHFDLGFQVAIAGEIGARVAFVIVEFDRFAAGAIHLREFLLAGRVVLGGVVAGTVYAVYVFRKHRLPLGWTLDAGFTGVALGMAIGRIACLLGGCCFGRPTDLAWGITFTDPLAQRLNGTPLGVPLHPTQPLLAGVGFVLFLILLAVHLRGSYPGQASLWFLTLQGASRFGIEFLRGDPRGAGAGLATSQWIGLAMIAAGVAGFVVRRVRARGAGAGDVAV